MAEVCKKKKKKRHHSSSSNDFEAPSKRMKIEINDTAAPSDGLNCDALVVERQKKKKHKHQRTAGVNVDITGQTNVELSRTVTDGQHDMSDVNVEHQTFMSGLEKCSPHKRPKHTEHQDGSRQQQSLANSNQTTGRLLTDCPELRFQQPAGFADVHPSTSDIWWEDVAGNEEKELWLVRAPADCTPSVLDHCSAVIGQSVQFSTNEVDRYDVSVHEPGDQSGRLVVLLPSKCDHKYRLVSPIHNLVTVTKNIFNKHNTEKESKSRKKKKKHKHAKHERTEHAERNS